MEYIQLGNTDIKLPPITFGGNVFGWTADKKQSFYLLDVLFDKGFNFIDTANVYSYWAPGNSGGESEAIIGEWLDTRKNRDKVIIATKVGSPMGTGAPNLSVDYINKQIELSLKRLKTDYIDIYFSHKYDDSTAQRETLAAYKNHINAGKVRTIGASNFPLAILREAIDLSSQEDLPRYQVIQPEYNLMDRAAFEGAYERFCIENNLSVTSYFTLASGFLTGKYTGKEDIEDKDRAPFLKKYFNKKGERVLKALKEVAAKYNTSEATITLAWTIAQPGITSPIASATKESQLEAFTDALNIDLDSEDLKILDEASI
ncbi:aldo/keto reductase [Leeuwenhoekiella aequorea]|uniref:Aryl-alcohol dehydrogenase-like predicted oxidoreductase n=1 Tax=Leeuwenhoekiella aequorea TaxID=283736 RepID=A0A4Q0PC10_9FLAO|nr:aldo/keto reductase [Leeuwenhoekiella aequorea]RXG23509.1 aryl-alcohol dehydrogenase-like predicted oxidoreductase [Leeuwenhoekiella aequorea]